MAAAPRSFFDRHATVAALASRDFRLLLLGTALVGLINPLQAVTQVFWAQERFADDAVRYATVLAGSRGAAMVVFSFAGGAIADRYERRRVLLGCESTALVNHALVAALMIAVPFGEATVALVALFTFVGAGVQAIDLPARQASIPTIVGMDRLSNAISLNTLAMQLMVGLSLPITGLLNEFVAPGWAYAASLSAWGAVIPLILVMRFRSVGAARTQNMLRNVVEGVGYSRRHPVILGVVAVMLCATLIGMPAITIPFGPIWITEVLGRSEGEFGFIAMAWGLGSIAGAYTAARSRALTERGWTLLVFLATFGLAVVIFGQVRIVPGAVVGNIVHGFSFSVLIATSATIVQHAAAEEMRGRVMGLFPLMQGMSQLSVPVYGELVGRGIFSLIVMVPTMGWATVGAALVLAVVFPRLRSTRVAERPAEAEVPAPAG